MFKLVVLSALVAAAAAKPQFLSSAVLAPAAYAATIAAPATTSTYVRHSSSYIAPTIYSDIAYPHFIKKRSPQFYGAYAPYYSSYLAPSAYYAGAPLASSFYSSLLPGYVAPAHFIKKRSVPLLAASSYIAPALTSRYYAAAPQATFYTSTYYPSGSDSPLYSNYLPTLPFIKK